MKPFPPFQQLKSKSSLAELLPAALKKNVKEDRDEGATSSSEILAASKEISANAAMAEV